MKATKNPGTKYDWTNKTWAEIATAYGLTPKKLGEEAIKFQNCEGFDSDGNESDDLHEWLTVDPTILIDTTPWQKGDNLNA